MTALRFMSCCLASVIPVARRLEERDPDCGQTGDLLGKDEVAAASQANGIKSGRATRTLVHPQDHFFKFDKPLGLGTAAGISGMWTKSQNRGCYAQSHIGIRE